MLWLSLAYGSMYTVVSLLPNRPVPVGRVQVEMRLFGEDGPIYVHGLADTWRVRLRGPDGALVSITTYQLGSALRLHTDEAPGPGVYTVEVLSHHDLEGNRVTEGEGPSVWQAIARSRAVGPGEAVEAPGRWRWWRRRAEVEVSADTHHVEWETESSGHRGVARVDGTVASFAVPFAIRLESTDRVRAVSVGPTGRVAGPWSPAPALDRYRGYDTHSFVHRWTEVQTELVDSPVISEPQACRLAPTTVLSTTAQPGNGRMMVDSAGTSHAVTVGQGLWVDGLFFGTDENGWTWTATPEPLFGRVPLERVDRLSGSGDELVVVGMDPVHRRRAIRLRDGTDQPLPVQEIPAPRRLPYHHGVVVDGPEGLELHDLVLDTWRVRRLECTHVNEPSDWLPLEVLRRHEGRSEGSAARGTSP